ncbi:toll/interleukin-1 receptor domain-containing protein [Litoreibacter albidus]|uniref:TIR domain-containing protein n=1 Tax=Litoreibacter albidus TaxID=670155 RepID=A0A1H2QPT9_9RHOB|nr:toll/interleukin-1 receptor domain-containing protein [Litoreibacter albidus]SDW09141.1 TIR domain-containing protein [Litoreibacter albidus]
MSEIFLSYSRKDRFFAELLESKLLDGNIKVWRDSSSLIAGDEWRQSIDLGITAASVLIVILSKSACESQYVTYEWARGIAQQKTIIPVMIEGCDRHPRIEPIQYLDFRNHTASTWEMLLQRIKNALKEGGEISNDGPATETVADFSADDQKSINSIIAYMNSKGFFAITYERAIQITGGTKDQKYFEDIVKRSPRFVEAKISGKGQGLALL